RAYRTESRCIQWRMRGGIRLHSRLCGSARHAVLRNRSAEGRARTSEATAVAATGLRQGGNIQPAKFRAGRPLMRKYFALVLLVASFSGWALVDDRPSSSSSISTNDHGDPILKAMLAELKRSQEKLQFGQFQRPYFIDYQVTEVQDYSSDAILGAIRADDRNVGRLVRVVVRIGDHKQDSYFGEGTGTVEIMPMDNNEMALRHTLWLATDKAYKA